MLRSRWLWSFVVLGCLLPVIPEAAEHAPPEKSAAIRVLQDELAQQVAVLRKQPDAARNIADVEIFGKAADWIVRHEEFYKPEFADRTIAALKTGLARAELLSTGKADWDKTAGRKILAYRSVVDESLQPYAISLPADFDAASEKKWPLHVVLHGRGKELNEVSFIHSHEGKPAVDKQGWIQLDVFGRTNNAYRWAGETDVFEALADVKRRYRIDERRVVLRGFSMGGAGSWHLGMHFPSLWCSVGPGAGFVDFYKYQKVSEPLPAHQDRVLHIYNPTSYALNAFNVPVCTYGGELDPQLAASQTMQAAAEKLGVSIKVLIGPQTAHKFHPDSLTEYMAFHAEKEKAGRPAWNDVRRIRFVTWTPKYNTCDWLTVEELLEPYRETTVEARVDEATGRLVVKTTNVAALQLSRDIAHEVELDGIRLPLRNAAQGLLPGVYYERNGATWAALDYDASRAFPANADLHKRRNLQGPIDDAFMQPFVCVRGTGPAWNAEHAAWANWTLDRFSAEFDKWLRGRVPVVSDGEVTTELITSKNLILFGDPGSNTLLAKVLPRLPVKWTKDGLEVAGESYPAADHGLSLIYPNPLNPRRYVVINSGHTFHAKDFESSNAWLFPRLGDIAVQRFEKASDGGYREGTVWAEVFDSQWKLPAGKATAAR